MTEMTFREALEVSRKMTQLKRHLEDADKVLSAAERADGELKRIEGEIVEGTDTLDALNKNIFVAREGEKEAVERKRTAALDAGAKVAREKGLSDKKIEAARAEADAVLDAIKDEMSKAGKNWDERKIELEDEIESLESLAAERKGNLDRVNADIGALQKRIGGR